MASYALDTRIRAVWQRGYEHYAALQPREQKLVVAGIVVVMLALLYLVAWQPVATARTHNAIQLGNARTTAAQIERLATLVPNSHAAPVHGAIDGQSLLMIVDRASRGVSGLAPPSRLQPDGDDKIRVWFDHASFDALVRWMETLQTSDGVVVDTADINRASDAGYVDARIVLRGSN